MTLQQAAKDAIACQDACNGRGIARSMVQAMDAVAEQPRTSTTTANQSPITFMFLYKLMALAGHEPLNLWDEYSEAEKACQAIAAEVAA